MFNAELLDVSCADADPTRGLGFGFRVSGLGPSVLWLMDKTLHDPT